MSVDQIASTTEPRQNRSALEARARRAARRIDHIATKSRRTESLDNFGGFMLVDLYTNCVVAGIRYELSAEDVLDYCRESTEDEHCGNPASTETTKPNGASGTVKP